MRIQPDVANQSWEKQAVKTAAVSARRGAEGPEVHARAVQSRMRRNFAVTQADGNPADLAVLMTCLRHGDVDVLTIREEV